MTGRQSLQELQSGTVVFDLLPLSLPCLPRCANTSSAAGKTVCLLISKSSLTTIVSNLQDLQNILSLLMALKSKTLILPSCQWSESRVTFIKYTPSRKEQSTSHKEFKGTRKHCTCHLEGRGSAGRKRPCLYHPRPWSSQAQHTLPRTPCQSEAPTHTPFKIFLILISNAVKFAVC